MFGEKSKGFESILSKGDSKDSDILSKYSSHSKEKDGEFSSSFLPKTDNDQPTNFFDAVAKRSLGDNMFASPISEIDAKLSSSFTESSLLNSDLSGSSFLGGESVDNSMDILTTGVFKDKNNMANRLNVRASNYGNLSMVDRMRGGEALRTNIDEDVTISDMYADKALDSRFFGGQYNVTITDIYSDEQKFKNFHGLNTDGKIELKNGVAQYQTDSEIADNEQGNREGGFESLGTAGLTQVGNTIPGQDNGNEEVQNDSIRRILEKKEEERLQLIEKEAVDKLDEEKKLRLAKEAAQDEEYAAQRAIKEKEIEATTDEKIKKMKDPFGIADSPTDKQTSKDNVDGISEVPTIIAQTDTFDNNPKAKLVGTALFGAPLVKGKPKPIFGVNPQNIKENNVLNKNKDDEDGMNFEKMKQEELERKAKKWDENPVNKGVDNPYIDEMSEEAKKEYLVKSGKELDDDDMASHVKKESEEADTQENAENSDEDKNLSEIEKAKKAQILATLFAASLVVTTTGEKEKKDAKKDNKEKIKEDIKEKNDKVSTDETEDDLEENDVETNDDKKRKIKIGGQAGGKVVIDYFSYRLEKEKNKKIKTLAELFEEKDFLSFFLIDESITEEIKKLIEADIKEVEDKIQKIMFC